MTRFLVDRMLGQTAKWLRLLGLDAEYAPECEDKKLLEIAEKEDRVIITRDRDLEGEERTFLVKKEPAEVIVKKVIKNYDVEIDPLSRCSRCNTSVKSVGEKRVEGNVPERILDEKETFWHCPSCDRYYWKGSHWDKIMDKIERILRENEL